MPIICTINGVTVSSQLKAIDPEPGGDGIVGQARLTFDQQPAGMDIRNMHDVRVWQTFDAGGNGIAARGRLFGGHVNLRATSNVGTTKTWSLTCWDYNVVLKKVVRDAQAAWQVHLTADTFAGQVNQLVTILQYNFSASPPTILIDATTGVEDLYATMPDVVYEGGHSMAWYIQQLCNTAQLNVPALRPHFYLGTDTDFGALAVFGNPVLWIYDGATLPAPVVAFSDTPTGGQKPLYGIYKRSDDSSVMVQRQQSLWNKAIISTSEDSASQSTYPNPYIVHDSGTLTGYWMDEVTEDSQSVTSAEAQAALDRVIAAKANPKETFEWDTEERILPGEVVELTWALDGISAQTYRVAKVKMTIEPPEVIRSHLTVNNRRLLLFDNGMEEVSGLPIELNAVPAGLQNPSFEHTRGNGTAYNWTVTTVGAGAGTVDTTTAAEGHNSFHFSCPSPSDEVTLTSDLFQAHYPDADNLGAKYYLELKMKRGADNVNAIDLYVDWYDESGTLLDTQVLVSGLNLLTTFSSYRYAAVWPDTTPENTVAAKLRFHCQPMSGSYDWWIDALDFSIPRDPSVQKNAGGDLRSRGMINFIEGPGIQIDIAENTTDGKVDVTFTTLPNPGSGAVAGYRDEVTPAAAATTVTLTYVPAKMMTVARNGVEQSSHLGHWSLSDNVLTFTDAFDGTDEVVAAYLIGGTTPILPPVTVASTPGADLVFSLWNGSSNDPPPAGWQLPAFDDSLWDLASGATGSYPPVTGSSRIWDATQDAGEFMLVRRHFTLSSGTVTSASIRLRIDNLAPAIYMNGVFVGAISDPLIFRTADTVFTIPQSAFVPGSDNVLAIYAQDTGSGGWASYRLEVS